MRSASFHKWPGQRLAVDADELLALGQSRARHRISVADVRDDEDLCDLAQGLGHVPADQGNADPFRIGGLRDQQDLGARAASTMTTCRLGGWRLPPFLCLVSRHFVIAVIAR
jgi:hypothetical protein